MVRSVIRSVPLVVVAIGMTSSSLPAQPVKLPSPEQLRSVGLELEWHTQVSMVPGRDTLRDIAFDGESLYAQTSRGVIHTIATQPAAAPNSSSGAVGGGGQTLWINQVGEPNLPSYRPAANSKELFVVNGSKLYTLEKNTGKLLWHTELPNSPSAPLAASDDFVYIGFIDGQLRAYALHPPRSAWFYRTGETIRVAALPIEDLVAFASMDGILYVSTAAERNLLFQYETDFPVSADLTAQGEWIYMASEDFNVYCIDARSGLTRWRRSLGEPITRPLVIIGNEIYVTPEGRGLHSLDASNGERRWWDAGASRFVSASPARVYAYDALDRLVVLDRATGQRVGGLDLRAFPIQVLNGATDRLYVASRNGLLLSLRESEHPLPVYHPGKSPREAPVEETTALLGEE